MFIVRSVPVRFYFLEQRSYFFIKTIDPDELPEIHYCLAGGSLDLRLLAAKTLCHPAHEILSEAFKRTRVSQG